MRGQANVIIATVFVSMVLLAVVPLLLYMFTAASNSAQSSSGVYEPSVIVAKATRGDITALYEPLSDELLVVNKAGRELLVEDMLVYVTCDAKGLYISLNSSGVLPPGGSMLVNVSKVKEVACSNPEYMAIYIVTREGVVVSATVITRGDVEKLTKPKEANTTLPVSYSIPIIPIKVSSESNISDTFTVLKQAGFDILTLNNAYAPTMLVAYSDYNSTGITGGSKTQRYTWKLSSSSTNIPINRTMTIRNLWIGYDPRDPSKYNILFTTSDDMRIKIYGFKPNTTYGILCLGNTWIKYPDQNIANYTFKYSGFNLYLGGVADRVEYYTRSSLDNSSYGPYIMLMNTDKSRGLAGVLFTTIDNKYGFAYSRNDGFDSLLDYSTKPLVLVYRGFEIPNSKYTAVVLTVNYRFHDNEGDDAGGTTVDYPVMFVGLVDENNVVYSYRSYTFRELTRYEDTYPPVAQAQSSVVFIPLPPPEVGEKKFYVFIAIQDPYWYNENNYKDDLDFTLYIESLTLIPVS